MKARAASPDVLVDLNRLEELRGIAAGDDDARARRDGDLHAADARPAVRGRGRSSPRSPRTIADVQVRNRGTIGGNVCSNDPTNHFPPLMAALGAPMTIRGADGERDGAGGGLLPRRLPDRGGPASCSLAISIPPGGGQRRLRRGDDRPRRNVHRQRRRGPRRRGARIAIGCVDAVPVLRRPRPGADEESVRAGRAAAQRSTRRRTSTPRPTTVGTSPRCSPSAPSSRPSRKEASVMEPVQQRPISVEVNGERYEAEVEARRLLVHFLRDDLDLTGTHIGCDTGNCGACSVHRRRAAGEELHAARGPGRRRLDRDGRGTREDDELTTLQQAFSAHHALQCGYCTPGMLMSATALLRAEPASRPRRRCGRRSRATSAAAPATGTSSRRSSPPRRRA